MPLPRAYPVLTTTLPVSKKKIKYRPYTLKEETILTMAKQSEKLEDMVTAVQQICENCIVDGTSVKKMAATDTEHLLICLRQSSVGEVITLTLNGMDCPDEKCTGQGIGKCDLRKIELTGPIPPKLKIKINDTITLVTRHPSFEGIVEAAQATDILKPVAILASAIDCVVEAGSMGDGSDDTIYYADDCTGEELIDWVQSLTLSQCETLSEFIDSIPTVHTNVEFTCDKCGHKKTVEIKGAQSFFG